VHSNKETNIRELGSTKLTLRPDLVFSPQSFGSDNCYTIEDPVNSSFYRVGIAEYRFISLLDGQSTVSHALALVARAHPEGALTEQEAAVICKWLVESELAFTSESSRPARLKETAAATARARASQNWNPAVIRLPLLQPDRFFNAVIAWISWLYSPAALAVLLLVAIVAAYHLASRWDRFVASSQGILAPDNWLWLGFAWIVLKVLHELSHGAVCKRYGGAVREAGIMLIMLAPVAYVDVTSSWSFRSKWQRIHTAAAGVIAELFIASLAALAWSRTEHGPFNLLCSDVVWMASVGTILFNANPLMKFDGYYMLSDLLEIPNLYMLGQQAVRSWFRRRFLGLASAPAAVPASRHRVIGVYGWLSLVWRTITIAGLLVASTTLLHGAGIILTGLAATLWFGPPAGRFVRFLWQGTPTERPNRLRFFATASLAVGGIVALVASTPWPFAVRAPAVVEYAPLTVVRTASSGFVREVHVIDGQCVGEGDVLAVLESAELQQELADLELAVEQSHLKARMHEKSQHLAAYQAELENAEALAKKHREKQSQVDGLTIRAPVGGRVIGRNLDALDGRYFSAGSAIVSIGAENRKEVQIAISQDDVDAFAACVDRPLTARLVGGVRLDAVLQKVNPRASVTPPHPSLCAPNGGPLPVRQVGAGSSEPHSGDDKFELLEPGFSGVVALDGRQSAQLRAGQRGVVTARAPGQSIGRHVHSVVERWVQRRLKPPNRT
jgi:putative peptide zinc metalloprotease protein